MTRALFLLLFIMSSAVFAQLPDKCGYLRVPPPAKADEFGSIADADFESRMESFFTELEKSPSAQGYIINYGAAEEVVRREKLVQKSVVLYKYEASRITIVRGGEAVIPKTELWSVPPGSVNPVPDYYNNGQSAAARTNRTGENKEGFPKAYRLEEFGEVSDRFFKYIFSEFFRKLEEGRVLKGYIVISGNDAEISAFEGRIRNLELFRQKNNEKVIFLRSEAQKQPTVALWLAPEKAEIFSEKDLK